MLEFYGIVCPLFNKLPVEIWLKIKVYIDLWDAFIEKLKRIHTRVIFNSYVESDKFMWIFKGSDNHSMTVILPNGIFKSYWYYDDYWWDIPQYGTIGFMYSARRMPWYVM